MTYINVGANTSDGMPILTKKALKTYMVATPEIVIFYSTVALGPEAGKTFRGNDLPQGYKLSVCGPDPMSKRVWYATVTDNGKVS